jgi:hypothetical protein
MNSVSRILATARPSLAASAKAYTTAASEAPKAAVTEGYYKVTQTRSLIGVPKSTIKGTCNIPANRLEQGQEHGRQEGGGGRITLKALVDVRT